MSVFPPEPAVSRTSILDSAYIKPGILTAGICLAAFGFWGGVIVPVVEAQVIVSAKLTAAASAIVGTVVNANDTPVPAARVRLRDLETGRILMITRGDEQGRFEFSGVPPGSYVVELVDDASRVLGVSQTFATAPAQLVQVMVRVSARPAWYTGLFTNAAIAAVSSAASLGITSVGPGLQPDSGRF